ncbi:MAG: hypothetical protein MUD08_08850 [Cytophagales bacterium]|jgi:phenylpyruvate tautomerase PptA (4-oxalocrotonate tautomerase family)|nr:hypothetical protein [Cytophagales bacterium]
MPYLRITCPALDTAQYADIAQQLTNAVNDLFFNPKGGPSREELRERTTVHFVPYRDGEVYVGARTPQQRGQTDITVELSDWYMSVKQQRKVATRLTPLLASLFGVPAAHTDSVNFRFHSYPPTDFSVGGKLLSDLVPYAGRLAKKLFG